jgi:hypothetical protein
MLLSRVISSSSSARRARLKFTQRRRASSMSCMRLARDSSTRWSTRRGGGGDGALTVVTVSGSLARLSSSFSSCVPSPAPWCGGRGVAAGAASTGVCVVARRGGLGRSATVNAPPPRRFRFRRVSMSIVTSRAGDGWLGSSADGRRAALGVCVGGRLASLFWCPPCRA